MKKPGGHPDSGSDRPAVDTLAGHGSRFDLDFLCRFAVTLAALDAILGDLVQDLQALV